MIYPRFAPGTYLFAAGHRQEKKKTKWFSERPPAVVNAHPNWEDTVLHKPLPLHCYSVLCFLCELWISVLLYTPTQQFINFRVSRPALVGSTFCSPGVEVVVGPHAREITWNPSYRSVTSDFTHLLIILRNLEHSCMDRWTVFPVT